MKIQLAEVGSTLISSKLQVDAPEHPRLAVMASNRIRRTMLTISTRLKSQMWVQWNHTFAAVLGFSFKHPQPTELLGLLPRDPEHVLVVVLEMRRMEHTIHRRSMSISRTFCQTSGSASFLVSIFISHRDCVGIFQTSLSSCAPQERSILEIMPRALHRIQQENMAIYGNGITSKKHPTINMFKHFRTENRTRSDAIFNFCSVWGGMGWSGVG